MRQPRLDPAAAQVIEHLAQTMNVGPDSDPEQLRKDFAATTAWLREPATPTTNVGSEDRTIDGPETSVPVRLYTPASGSTQDIIVYIHGGGWVVGGLDTADAIARVICSVVDAAVVSVDYRLAPDHPFPAARSDCATAIRWAAGHHPRWLGVAGDSAGGNLAAVMANEFSDLIDAQLLLYPALDPRQDTASYRTFAEGYRLTSAAMNYYWRSYATPEQYRNPTVAPVFHDEMSTSPAAVIATAHFDPLHDEGQAYAARLVEAGVPTVYLPSATLPHGWADLTDRVPAAARALCSAASALAELRDRAVREPEDARRTRDVPAQRS
ncbi:alpha/beta hydrolase [Rugosimonospora africana]|uniref:Putative lipase LipH n=1 Tax=Rugosimonospora africana TaxID=556532 RepID=A0A8J3VQJ3_9ACTN|nr:alpha/beta hydrolase [Rugosimonospora africana]GIH15190.1 putative lipase LipH [Rugosimonospora africana]